MDRLPRTFVALGFGLLMTATGCRSTRPEVPPGRGHDKDGIQRKAIEFSSDGHPVGGAASTNFGPNDAGNSRLARGIDAGVRPSAGAFGAPSGLLGPPGTSGAAQPPAGMPSVGMPPAAMPPADLPPTGTPPGADPNLAPPRSLEAAPNQVIQAPMDKPGAMGRPDQMPSPN